MALLRTKKRLVTSFAVIVLLCGAAFYALAQQTGEAKKAPAPQAGPKRPKLAGPLETGAWGWAEPKEPPQPYAESGGNVAPATKVDAPRQERPRKNMGENVAPR